MLGLLYNRCLLYKWAICNTKPLHVLCRNHFILFKHFNTCNKKSLFKGLMEVFAVFTCKHIIHLRRLMAGFTNNSCMFIRIREISPYKSNPKFTP